MAGVPESVTTLYTIGHSTRALPELIQLLQAHGVTLVVDIRTIPRSRHNPQFNEETLPQALQEAGIGYRHLTKLGGLRYARLDSVNTGLYNTSFRGFADYMQTQEFDEGLHELITLAREQVLVFMCAETVPWRCHRFLVADALVVRGYRVDHIISAKSDKAHTLSQTARDRG